MLAFALPFAVSGALAAKRRQAKVLYLLAAAIVFIGCIATLRKTAAIVPVAAILTLVAFRPREMLRLWPAGLLLLLLAPAMAPDAAGQVKSQLSSISGQPSTEGRTADYDAVQPDFLAHRTIGRGYGTYDHEKYRLLDNEYLGLLIGTGIVGFATFVAMILGVVLIAVRPIRSRDPVRGPPALAAAAAAVAFGVVAALFDVMAFPQTPYLFFFVAAIAVVAASRSANDRRAGSEAITPVRPSADLYVFDARRSRHA
jgi:O-antigen ligase